MEQKKTILTYAGLKKLEDELHDLKVNKRREIAGKIKEAREQGDLSENAEYDAAKDEQRDIEARIEEIEKILKNADGTLNREAILTFWEQTKRIYDVQMASASEEKVEQYQMILPMYEQEYGSSYEDSSWFGYINALDYIGGSTHMMAGIADTPYTQAELYSLSKNKGCEDAVVRLMSGTAGKVYIPELMIGINASSANVDSSKEFLTDFLGDEILESMGGFPVSKTAMEQAFVPNPQDYVEGQPMYYAASSDPEGNMIEEQIWWPVDGDLEPFYRMVEEVTVPYVQDAVLEEAVYQAGTAYFEGASTLEEAWDELQSQISLYMAE